MVITGWNSGFLSICPYCQGFNSKCNRSRYNTKVWQQFPKSADHSLQLKCIS